MTKLVIVEIDGCYSCPYFGRTTKYCQKVRRKITHNEGTNIPSDCPYDDKELNE